MRKWLLILVFLALVCVPVLAQGEGNTIILKFAGVPTGTCSFIMMGLNSANGDLYDCPAGAWVKTGTGGGGGAVTSVSGDGVVITNAASVGAVTLTIAGTSGGIPFFNSATSWSSSALLTNNSPVMGGGAGAAPKTATFLTTNGANQLTIGVAGGGNGTLGLAGNTSGTATLTAPATAGTTTNPVVSSNSLNAPVFLGGDGTSTLPSVSLLNATGMGLFKWSGTNSLGYVATNHGFFALAGTTPTATISGSNGGYTFTSSGVLAWVNSSTDATATKDTGISRSAVGVAAVGTGGLASKAGLLQSGMSVFVTTNFTTSGVGTALENITGLTWTFPATALNWPFHCHIAYSQAVGTAAVAFGIKASTNNPTNIFATGELFTAAGTVTTGVLATLATQTATNIVSGTPGATGANMPVDLYGELELPASAVAINIMTSTATAADTVTVLRGSYCSLNP